MMKVFAGTAATLVVATLFTLAVPWSQAADELALTYTKPECSTTVR